MTGDFASFNLNLTNHFLIAMPALQDGLFSKSVVYICEHNARGALGLVINKPTDFTLSDLLQKVDISVQLPEQSKGLVVHGGPVHTERGFILHDTAPDRAPYNSTVQISGGLEMTTSKDVLHALAQGTGPHRHLAALGYAAWSEGQLEGEIANNSWLTVAAQHHLIFDTPMAQRYDKAMALLGLQAWMISSEVGHA
jgi:putative transcriptional regulator